MHAIHLYVQGRVNLWERCHIPDTERMQDHNLTIPSAQSNTAGDVAGIYIYTPPVVAYWFKQSLFTFMKRWTLKIIVWALDKLSL